MRKAPDIESAVNTAGQVRATCWLMENLLKNLNGEQQRGAVFNGMELQGLVCVFHNIIVDMESIEAELEPA